MSLGVLLYCLFLLVVIPGVICYDNPAEKGVIQVWYKSSGVTTNIFPYVEQVTILENHFTQSFEWSSDCTKLLVLPWLMTELSQSYFNHDFSVSFNENISLFGLILIYNSSWPATVECVTNVFLSRITINSTDPSYIKRSLSINIH